MQSENSIGPDSFLLRIPSNKEFSSSLKVTQLASTAWAENLAFVQRRSNGRCAILDFVAVRAETLRLLIVTWSTAEMNFKQKKAHWPNTEQLQELRTELHKRISNEEHEPSQRLEGLNRLINLSQMEPLTFHRQWIVPLLDAGATLEVATACIVQSYLQPN